MAPGKTAPAPSSSAVSWTRNERPHHRGYRDHREEIGGLFSANSVASVVSLFLAGWHPVSLSELGTRNPKIGQLKSEFHRSSS
jgi:hypothetical protein